MYNHFAYHNVCEGVDVQIIKDDRFKTGRISATIFMPLDDDTVAANAILPFIISDSCAKYPDITSLNRRLNELYGASICADSSKLGEVQALTISTSFLDDRYSLHNENMFAELTDLLCGILFEPHLQNGAFVSEDIEQQRRQLVELIDSEYNDKRILAKIRCEQLMCKNERFGISQYGKKEQVLALTKNDVYDAWQRALKKSRIQFMVLGHSDGEDTLKVLRQYFSRIDRREVPDCHTEVIERASSVTEHCDHMDIAQSKLVMGFRTGIHQGHGNVMAARMMVALFGSTPTSKLFQNVREKLSLCYYCSSRYDRNKGIMVVQSGVEKQNIEKAKAEILNQLDQIRMGNITDEELTSTRLSLANSFRTIGDYLSGLENFYISQVFDDKRLTPEQFVDEINAVTKEQIIDAAKSVSLDTVYTLTSNDKEANV